MKQLLFIISIFFVGALSAQQIQGHVYFPDNVNAPLTSKEKAQIEEVYGKDAAFVMERPSLLKNLKDLLRNRVEVMYLDYQKAQGSNKYKNAPDLSVSKLYTVYNKNLINDGAYNARTFNILKYALNFYPTEKETYKLGNYYITILPQSRKVK